MMGASNVIFMNFHEEIAIFRQYILDTTNHGYPSSFDVLQLFVVLSFHDLSNLVNSKCLLGLWINKHANLQCETLKKGSKMFILAKFVQ